MANVQRQLELELSQLYRNRGQLERKQHEIEAQEKRVAERTAKRLQAENDPSLSTSNKRLKSTVGAKNIDNATNEDAVEEEPKHAPRPVVQASEVERGRNRRLIGNLLLGTLSQFQRQVVEKPDENLTKKLTVEKEIDEKVEKDQDALLTKEQERVTQRRQEFDSEWSQLKLDIASKEKELKEHVLNEHQVYLQYYAQTKAEPRIYFRPKKVDEWSSTTFGFTIPPVEIRVCLVSQLEENEPNKLDMALTIDNDSHMQVEDV